MSSQIRYLALGDSYTIGTGASDESHNFPSILSGLVSKATGSRVELTNPAVNGFTTLDLKFAALKKHKSQIAKPGQEWDFEKFMRKRHREIGKKAGFRYAESFKRITV